MRKKLLFLLLIFFSSCSEKVDLIVHNATIYSVDTYNTKYSSLAVKDGKFKYVGGDEILSNFSSKNIINAQGLPIYPGFIDSHAHFYGLGFSNAQVDLKGTKSLEEIVEKVIEFNKNDSVDTSAEWSCLVLNSSGTG